MKKHEKKDDIWAGGWVKPGVAGRRLSPAVGVRGRPGPSAGSETLAGAGARGNRPPSKKRRLRSKISSTKKNRPLDNRIQVIYIIVNKCSNEQKVTNIPSFSSL